MGEIRGLRGHAGSCGVNSGEKNSKIFKVSSNCQFLKNWWGDIGGYAPQTSLSQNLACYQGGPRLSWSYTWVASTWVGIIMHHVESFWEYRRSPELTSNLGWLSTIFQLSWSQLTFHILSPELVAIFRRIHGNLRCSGVFLQWNCWDGLAWPYTSLHLSWNCTWVGHECS